VRDFLKVSTVKVQTEAGGLCTKNPLNDEKEIFSEKLYIGY